MKVDMGLSATRRQQLGAAWLLSPPLLFLLVLFLIPLSKMGWTSVWDKGLTFGNYAEVAVSPMYLNSLLWTFQLAAGTSILCLIIGYPVAFAMANAGRKVQIIILACIILPFWTSSLVRAFSWMAILGRRGLVNNALIELGLIESPLTLVFNTIGVYIGTIHVMLPYMILSLFSVMVGIDRTSVRSAESLGASPIRAFFLAYVPQTMPGIISGLLLVFILSLGFFVTPAVLGGADALPFVVLVERYMNQLLNWPMASTLSVILVFSTLVIYVSLRGYIGIGSQSSSPEIGKGLLYRALASIDRLASPARRFFSVVRARTNWYARRSLSGVSLPILALALAISAIVAFPIILIVLLAFVTTPTRQLSFDDFSLRWFELYFARSEWVEATVNSFQIATGAAIISSALATLAAFGLRQVSRKAGTIISAFLLMPMIVPGIVFGVGVYLFFAGLSLLGTKASIVLAHSILAIPPAFLLCCAAVQGLDERIEQSAASLGASAWRGFRHISFPLLLPAISAGALLGFLTSFDDLSVALFLTGGDSMTLPRKIYDSIRLESDPRVTAASALLVGLSTLILVVFQILRGRAAATSSKT